MEAVTEIQTTLVTAAREILEKQTSLHGDVIVECFDDNLSPKGFIAGFTMRAGRCVEFNPRPTSWTNVSPELLAKLTLTGADGEFKRAVVRGGQGSWQMAK